MEFIYIYIFVVSFAATLVRSTFGFGESLVAVPLFILFIPIEIAVPLSVLISIFVALVVVIQDHQQIHLNSAKWLIIFAVLGIPIGVIILIYGNAFWVKIGLGVLIVLYSLYAIFGKNRISLKTDNMLWLFFCGFASGILGGAYGVNGPPLVVYGNMRNWSAKHFRATLQAYFLPASFIAALGYFAKGLITLEVLEYFLISLPAVIPAIFLGRYLNHKIKDNSFFKYVYFGLIVIGIFLTVNSLLTLKKL
ncbi:sulfite exporter TauE/SafE family protein [Pedobacter nototheniae]|uniref:sulfite exporter TauE/SafE family protein n=1 Tax=Pedobacter nototheniae TaxID=2488994 RepID=UPI00292D9133|nr:sulfite exporter TauE/SafE family protein [Pedobacter nototheniae]